MVFNLNIDTPTLLAKGDSINLPCDIDVDLTGYKIRCELFDADCNSIKLATENSGGSAGDIEIDNIIEGLFTINVGKNLTTNFNDKGSIEIEVEDGSGNIYTIYKATFTFKNEQITWTDPNA